MRAYATLPSTLLATLLISGCSVSMAPTKNSNSLISTQSACSTLNSTQPSIEKLTVLSQCYADYTQSIAMHLDLDTERAQLHQLQGSLNELNRQTRAIASIYCELHAQCKLEVHADQPIYNDYYEIGRAIQQMNSAEGEPKQLSRLIRQLNDKVRNEASRIKDSNSSLSRELLEGLEACSKAASQS
jgi:hypothetical protein